MQMTTGELIAARRKELKMTQQELADRLYVSPKTVSKWETDRGMPETAMIATIARILEITADKLLGAVADDVAGEDPVLRANVTNAAVATKALTGTGTLLVCIAVMFIDNVWWLGLVGILLLIAGITYWTMRRNLLLAVHPGVEKNVLCARASLSLSRWWWAATLAPVVMLWLQPIGGSGMYVFTTRIYAAILIIPLPSILLTRMRRRAKRMIR
jgi:transcriptional regulator with XRE-family HTH domain